MERIRKGLLLPLLVFGLFFAGCGDSREEFVFTNTNNNPVGLGRQLVLDFVYTDPILAKVPDATAEYLVELYTSSGQLAQQLEVPRDEQFAIDDLPTDAFIVRVIALDGQGNTLGYNDYSIPPGTEDLTITVDVLITGAPAGVPVYSDAVGIPVRLAYLLQPENTVVEELFDVVVVALDATGQRVNSVTGDVDLDYNGAGTLSGDTSVAFSNGVAAFVDLSVDTLSQDSTLVASSNGLTSATSLPFDITTGGDATANIQVGASQAGDQEDNTIAVDSDGNFVIVWEQIDRTQGPPFAADIFVQRFAPDGATLSDPVQVNVDPGNLFDDYGPAVAATANGGFVVGWSSGDVNNNYESVVLLRGFDANEAPVGGQFQVSQGTNQYEEEVDIASAPNGSLVVVWTAYNPAPEYIFARVYDNTLTSTVSTFQVNTTQNTFQAEPTVGADSNLNFTVAWASGDNTNVELFGQQYQADGTVIGNEFSIGPADGANRYDPSLAMTPSGSFVVAYTREQAGPVEDVAAITYTAAAGVVVGETVLNTSNNEADDPRIAIRPDGRFVAVWEEETGNNTTLRFARFGADATLDGPDTSVSTDATEEVYDGVPAINGNGTIGITWERDLDANNNDGPYDAFVRFFPAGTP